MRSGGRCMGTLVHVPAFRFSCHSLWSGRVLEPRAIPSGLVESIWNVESFGTLRFELDFGLSLKGNQIILSVSLLVRARSEPQVAPVAPIELGVKSLRARTARVCSGQQEPAVCWDLKTWCQKVCAVERRRKRYARQSRPQQLEIKRSQPDPE